MKCMPRSAVVPSIAVAGVSDDKQLLAPLLPNSQSIRLLRYLSPGNPQRPLKFELAAFDLQDCPRYAALSYTWLNPFLEGHPRYRFDRDWDSRTGTIYCNDHPVSVLPNLLEALEELVACHGELLLFVDALCINQKDEEEKAGQVSLLAKIFTNADHCICWLGPADQTLGTCTLAMKTFYDILTQAAADCKTKDGWMDLPIQHARVMRHFPLGSSGIRLLKRAIFAIALLGKRRWFTRAWVTQEYALSKDAFLFCGRHTIDSQHLRMVSMWLHRAGGRSSYFRSLEMTSDERKDTRECIARMVELNQAQGLLHESSFVDHLSLRYGVVAPLEVQAAGLLDFLYRCRQCESFDERDRVYALSGMMRMITRDQAPCIVQPDYSLPVFEVFSQITSQLVQHLPTLDFLALAGRCFSDSAVKEELPTWVPDWGSLRECMNFRSSAGYKAGFPPIGGEIGPRVVDGSVLVLQGLYVDKVRQTGSHFTDVVKIASTYLNKPKKDEASSRLYDFWRTMLWGDDKDTNESQLNKSGIPWGQEDVAVDLLWLSRHEYRETRCNKEAVQEMAKLVEIVSGGQYPIKTLTEVIQKEKRFFIEDDKSLQRAFNRRAARVGERRTPTMVTCWSGPHRKAFCSTKGGTIGAGPLQMCKGDLIYVIRDARLPCLLREVPGRPGYFSFLGEIYVEGLASGQALQGLLTRWETLRLV